MQRDDETDWFAVRSPSATAQAVAGGRRGGTPEPVPPPPPPVVVAPPVVPPATPAPATAPGQPHNPPPGKTKQEFIDETVRSGVSIEEATKTADYVYGTGTGATAGAKPSGRTNAEYIRSVINEWAGKPGANPSLKNDPEYWVRRILETGGLGDDNMGYWTGRFQMQEGEFQDGGGNGGASGQLPAGLTNGSLMTPWTQQFQPGANTELPPAFDYPDWSRKFEAPTEVTEQNDPGFQARLKMGQQALERSAAAKGTLLTGGTAKALDQFGQDFASNEYSNVFDRAMTGYKSDQNDYLQNKGLALEKYGSAYGTANDMYNRARSQYDLSRDVFQQNQDRPFNKLFSLTNLGANTASGLNTNTLGYASLQSNATSDYLRQLFAGLR